MEDAGDGSFKLSPLVGHAIASELAMTIPMARMSVYSVLLADFDETDYNDDAGTDFYQDPPHLVIRRPDGGAVTVGDLVEHVHPYLKANRDDIVEFMDRVFGEASRETKIFYNGCSPPAKEEFVPGENDQASDDKGFCFGIEIFFRADEHETEQQHWRMPRRPSESCRKTRAAVCVHVCSEFVG